MMSRPLSLKRRLIMGVGWGRDENMTGSGIEARRLGIGDWGLEGGVNQAGWMDMEFLVVCMIEGW
jgi:hypothetical protein